MRKNQYDDREVRWEEQIWGSGEESALLKLALPMVALFLLAGLVRGESTPFTVKVPSARHQAENPFVVTVPEPQPHDPAEPDADGWRWSVPPGGSRPVWWRPLPIERVTLPPHVTRGGAGHASSPARPFLAPFAPTRGGNC